MSTVIGYIVIVGLAGLSGYALYYTGYQVGQARGFRAGVGARPSETSTPQEGDG